LNQQLERKDVILSIEVLDLCHSSSDIKLVGPGYPEDIIKSSVGSRKLARYHDIYREALDGFMYELQIERLHQNFQALKSALLKIFGPGRTLFESLFQDIRTKDKTLKLRNYLKKHKFGGLGPKYSPFPQIGVIEVITDDIAEIIPTECLVFDRFRGEIKNLQDMTKAVSGILGFSFIIRRVVNQFGLSQKQELNNIPKLPLKYFHYESLAASEIERAFFERNTEYFDLDGPWPAEDTYFAVEDFVKYLFRPDIGFCPTREERKLEHSVDEIHHLSCHCSTEEKESRHHYLELTGSGGIELGSMQDALQDYLDILEDSSDKDRVYEDGPLVFLNACGSSSLSPLGVISFPEYFLDRNKNRNCGFIGSETRIPDRFAAEFSKQFYLHLIQGFGVGESVFIARHKLLRKFKNPLGILYTSYVNPYLHVSRAVENLRRYLKQTN
jgi:hypothetical protein